MNAVFALRICLKCIYTKLTQLYHYTFKQSDLKRLEQNSK